MTPPLIQHGAGSNVRFWCSGCRTYHVVNTTLVPWNEDLTRPTFDKKITIHGPGNFRCSCQIIQGVAHYTMDSTHALAGRLVPLEDLP